MLLAPIDRPEFADVRREARSLYWRGWGITQIVDELNRLGEGLPGWKALKRSTVESWKQREKWDQAPSILRGRGIGRGQIPDAGDEGAPDRPRYQG